MHRYINGHHVQFILRVYRKFKKLEQSVKHLLPNPKQHKTKDKITEYILAKNIQETF